MIEIESGFTGTTYALANPRIAAMPITGTVTASTEATGFEAINANNDLTWTAWEPTAVPATWQLTFTSAAVSYIGIAAHNCGTVGATIAAQRWTGSAWWTVATHVPTDDSPILFLLTRRTGQTQFRLSITGAVPQIGVIRMGDVLELPQPARYTGSLPFNEASQDVFSDNMSDGGHVLESFKTRVAVPVSMQVDNLSETWWETNIPALAAHIGNRLPIFVADRPADNPKSVAFGRTDQPLQSERQRPVALASRQLNISLTGYNPA